MDNRKIRRFEVSSTLTRPDRSVLFTTLPLLVIAMLAMAIFASCSKKAVHTDRTFEIAGRVIDLANSRPIDSARVNCYKISTSFDTIFTDAAGTFTFTFLTDGSPLENVRVVVSKQDFTTFDTLIVRLDGNLTDWIIGLPRVQNVEKWEWLDVEVRLWYLVTHALDGREKQSECNMNDVVITPFRVERGPPRAIRKKGVTATPQNGDIERL